ncbi:MAG TPA: universal stress protein [Pseudacidobacterium sp.]|nr:universal stress protein [Pseudacidobacterium sp.]
MGKITNILFPVDFSESCVAMAPFVKRAAGLTGAKVSLIHVFDPASYNGFELYIRRAQEINEEHEQIARERLNSFLTTEFPVGEHFRIVRAGDAATEIARTARDGFGLIIMPTHAGGFFRRMLLGSVTAKILNDADCPVLTSTHAERITPHPLEHREWLCAIGLGENSERMLRFAHERASEVGAKLTIIHAIQAEDRELPIRLDLEEELHSGERLKTFEEIAELQKRVGLNAPVRVAVGNVKAALLEIARQSDADVLMIGRSPELGEEGRLRDLTYVMVRDSPFPVMSI